MPLPRWTSSVCSANGHDGSKIARAYPHVPIPSVSFHDPSDAPSSCVSIIAVIIFAPSFGGISRLPPNFCRISEVASLIVRKLWLVYRPTSKLLLLCIILQDPKGWDDTHIASRKLFKDEPIPNFPSPVFRIWWLDECIISHRDTQAIRNVLSVNICACVIG